MTYSTSEDEIRKQSEQAFSVGKADAEAVAERTTKGDTGADVEAEVSAIKQCASALRPLSAAGRDRVLLYLARSFEGSMLITGGYDG